MGGGGLYTSCLRCILPFLPSFLPSPRVHFSFLSVDVYVFHVSLLLLFRHFTMFDSLDCHFFLRFVPFSIQVPDPLFRCIFLMVPPHVSSQNQPCAPTHTHTYRPPHRSDIGTLFVAVHTREGFLFYCACGIVVHHGRKGTIFLSPQTATYSTTLIGNDRTAARASFGE